jgi:hypothetical protein
MKIILALFLTASANAAGVLINGNQINPQTAISISSLTVTGATGAVVTSTVNAALFIGAGTNLTGTAAALTAGHVTTNANLTGDVTSSGSNATTAAATQANIKVLSGLTTISNPYTATSSMTNTSAGGILASSSITASAFFGDGSHLSGVAANSTTTWTGSNTFTGAVHISTGFTINFAYNLGYTTTQSSLLLAVTGSTGSFVVQGTTVACWFAGDIQDSLLNQRVFMSAGVDGGPPAGTTVAHGFIADDAPDAGSDFNMSFNREFQVTAGVSHTFYFVIAANGGTVTLGEGGANSSVSQFGCREVPSR